MSAPDPTDRDRRAPAPGLREVAETRWDVDRDPVVAWSDDGRVFWLADPEEPTHRVELFRAASSTEEPSVVAAALAETVAACDFPPTDDRASQPRVRAALRAAGLGRLADRPDGSTP